jgi:hypothetical protein
MLTLDKVTNCTLSSHMTSLFAPFFCDHDDRHELVPLTSPFPPHAQRHNILTTCHIDSDEKGNVYILNTADNLVYRAGMHPTRNYCRLTSAAGTIICRDATSDALDVRAGSPPTFYLGYANGAIDYFGTERGGFPRNHIRPGAALIYGNASSLPLPRASFASASIRK